ncbi:MAG: hypothetical protein A3I05_03895 [Deltaproteobacteria bacterium RIFCSPLOWO2_02_FULL_44_10]|nr:MAG: hypothetical protein A3C46_08005 [Deltaproteobacteria bacterium RIFCSPHIGHO2_02_FULL_44_16]OGQ47105.1 MAG: hypothetical protein A3I05_03895 [Deltaproteobacteria bacterium RIFCSPLOWO2_02_FULL_44_10]
MKSKSSFILSGLFLLLSVFLIFNIFSCKGTASNSELKPITSDPYVSYDEAGRVAEEGQYKNGKPDGLWKIYDGGILWAEKSMKEGVEHEVTKIYHTNGTLMKEIPYMNGEVRGTYRQYDENGKLLMEKVFE